MGFAKYMEDNIEINNNRRFDKSNGLFNIGDFKQKVKKSPHIMSPEEEFILLLKEINKLKKWLDIININYKIMITDIVIQTLDRQRDQVMKIKDDYIDYSFDPKFETLRNKKYNANEQELKDYELIIIKSYIIYFTDELKTIQNYTNDDAIRISNLYLDLEAFIKEFLSLDIKIIKEPLVQYLREKVLLENNYKMIQCAHCQEKTYIDFNSCIRCKYPKGVR